MKISFKINYHTQWGESLFLYGDPTPLGSGDPLKALSMTLKEADLWQLDIELPDDTPSFDYHYVVKAQDREWRFEWGRPHKFTTGQGIRCADILDQWRDMPEQKPYYSSAFTDGIMMRKHQDQPLTPRPGTINLRVEAPMVHPDEVLAISGNCDALGNWNPQMAVRLNDGRYPMWETQIPTNTLPESFDFKFVILKKDGSGEPIWEYCQNRTANVPNKKPDTRFVVAGMRFANPRANWKGAGTAIPVFSIRSTQDFGVGDFLDLKLMVDWCVRTGQKVLQVLPINDTTMTGSWIDSYPYKANSTFALHPMFIRLEAVGSIADPERQKYYNDLRDELNALPEVDYERVNNAKQEYLREVFALQGSETLVSENFTRFFNANERWLRPYAAWCVLRDLNKTPDNTHWGNMSVYDEKLVSEFCAANADKINYYYYVQYHLDKQLRQVRDYAHQHGVVLKGDIPIGISRYSADAWQHPHLFNMNSQAGAPPDDFSVLGQNWGLPTYNWDEMARDGFAWWKDRFSKMADYFDAYRIDHILGFFRIWQISLEELHGLLGIFNPALPFSPDELRQSFDFWINPDVQCHPLIREWMLTDFFGEHTEEAKERFMVHKGDGVYELKPFIDTQRKVSEFFATKPKDEKNERMCQGLMGLIDDVLFVEDPYEKGKYHPRIAAQFTYQYRILTDYERWCFNRLYNDFFYHRHNDFWRGKAMWKLPPLLESTGMLCCAEDLGMIPACVPDVMRELQILSLEIQRMPKDPKLTFGLPWIYPYQSVCTTSTHDMPGIRQWWESDHSVAQQYFNAVMHQEGEAPRMAEPWICNQIIDMHVWSPSMLCILPLQDWLSIDGALRRHNPAEEVINVPSNPTHYWRYRMHLTAEQLLAADVFNDTIQSKLAESGRL